MPGHLRLPCHLYLSVRSLQIGTSSSPTSPHLDHSPPITDLSGDDPAGWAYASCPALVSSFNCLALYRRSRWHFVSLPAKIKRSAAGLATSALRLPLSTQIQIQIQIQILRYSKSHHTPSTALIRAYSKPPNSLDPICQSRRTCDISKWALPVILAKPSVPWFGNTTSQLSCV